MRLVFVRFLEEIEDTKKTFRNYLTFSTYLLTVFSCFYGKNSDKIFEKFVIHLLFLLEITNRKCEQNSDLKSAIFTRTNSFHTQK